MACGTGDSLIWDTLSISNCCFKIKTPTILLCRDPHNVNGICSRKSCPLANSQYSTVILKDGKITLYTKTAERAHMPSKLWDKVDLPEDFAEAEKIIDYELMYWDKWMIDKVKERFIRLTEVLENQRRIRMEENTVRVVPIKMKLERRNLSRETRALNVAHIQLSVKEELKRKLKAGEYGEIYNIQQEEFEDVAEEIEEPTVFVDESDFEKMFEEEEEVAEYELAE